MITVPNLIKETEDERWYEFERIEVDDDIYIRARVYKLTDRWRRTEDNWYKVIKEDDEEDEYKDYVGDFDIRMDYE